MALSSPRFRWNTRLHSVENNNPPMRVRERSHAVRLVQQSLIDLGAGPLPVSTSKYGSPDGIYGAETRAAVKAFQAQQSLGRDGVMGRKTIRRMDSLLPNANPRLPPLPMPLQFGVPGTRSMIAQPTNNVCWATAYTMMRSWRDRTSYDIATVMRMIGPWYLNRFNNNQSMPWSKYRDFFRDAGLTGEPMWSLPATEWVALLKDYGLLLIGAPWLPGPVGGHVRILEGVRGDGNIGSTSMMIMDPWQGRRYTETLELFTRTYEDGALQNREVQVGHF